MKLNGVFIIPTGIGCKQGGDAAFLPGVKLIAACSNNLIVNPNSVNASDINELPDNALYVEGSIIDRFLNGKFNLEKTKTFNRILMVVNSILPANINSMNAGIWGLGANIEIQTLKTPLKMKATLNSDGTAGGEYSGVNELIKQVEDLDFDALAIQTFIDCDPKAAAHYWKTGGTNPWGGIEAIISKLIAEKINKPVAHAPVDMAHAPLYEQLVVERSMAPEIISNTFTFCILKGLHKAPCIQFDVNLFSHDILSNRDINFLVTPHGCFGTPHKACLKRKIPIIVVRENTTCFSENFVYPISNNIIYVDNYLEAAGVIMAMNAGIDFRTVVL